ncbi:MAG: glycosyltransferase family 39 protein [Bryobacterales bacterium]
MPRPPVIALLAIVCLAAWIRLHDLDGGTFGHIESYTPGIVYPVGISDPPTRDHQWHNFVWAINDVHGPFWYLWMLPYVDAAGTSLTALRLPSAVLAIVSVLLAYLVALRVGGTWTAPLAAALLTLSGHHVYWSRQARFYSSACFLALLSTWFLLRVMEGKGRWSLAGYLASTLAGLATLYYYWPVALVQLVWVIAMEARRSPRMAAWQLWLFTLATPILTMAIFQARPGPYLAREDWKFLSGYFTFGYQLTPTTDSGSGLMWQTSFVWVLGPVALICCGFAVAALLRAPQQRSGCEAAPPPLWLFAATVVATTAGILYAGELAGDLFPHKIPLLRVSALFPVVGLAAYLVLRKLGPLLPEIPRVQSPLTLVAWLAFATALMIAVVGQAVDFCAPRAMLCFTPFLLVWLARGVVAMGRTGLAVAALLLVVSYGSVKTALADPGAVDYAGVARQWTPLIEEGDRIFIVPHWSTTPEFYYLQDHYAQLVGQDWLASDAQRVWAILVPGAPRPADFVEALEARERVRTLSGMNLEVALFERK